jgi:hypothetical protein
MACTGWILLTCHRISVYYSFILRPVNIGEYEWLCQNCHLYTCMHKSTYTHTPRKLAQAVRPGSYLGDAYLSWASTILIEDFCGCAVPSIGTPRYMQVHKMGFHFNVIKSFRSVSISSTDQSTKAGRSVSKLLCGFVEEECE